MDKNDIEVGAMYSAKVSDVIVTVRVDSIAKGVSAHTERTVYHVTNLNTGRKLVFRSAAKFRSKVNQAPTPPLRPVKEGNGQRDERYASTAVPAPTPAPALAAAPHVVNSNGTPLIAVATDDQVDPKPSSTAPKGAGSGLAGRLKGVGSLTPGSGVKDNAPHIMVKARAGTGKTFTLIVGVLNMFRDRIPGLWEELIKRKGFDPVPSPQQKMVWDAMKQSSDCTRTIRFCAFNKSIVRAFEQDWGWAVRMLAAGGVSLSFSTNHSLGLRAVTRALGRLEVNEWNVSDIICRMYGKEPEDLYKEKPLVLSATKELVSKAKMNLVPLDIEDDADREAVNVLLQDLADYYDIDLTEGEYGRGKSHKDEIFDLVPKVMSECKSPKGTIDFDDQIWLPVALGLPAERFDMLLVDEGQDLNRCQQALAKRSGHRIVIVGDEKQAIYQFAGADADSLPRLSEELGRTERGVIEIPLTVTRRCGKAIVAEAKKIVPDFEAHEDNPEGRVSQALWPTQETQFGPQEIPHEESYAALVRPGDMVLCRVNAPLVSQCFRFIRRGVRATIQGRDVAKGLTSTVEKMKAVSVPELVQKLSTWAHREVEKEHAKRFPSQNRVIVIHDRLACIMCFTENAASVQDVLRRIGEVFTDDRNVPGVKFSSIHRAKGLEADRVFFLMPKGAGCPHPLAEKDWEIVSERNLFYVAVTRSIHELIYVK